MAVLNVGSRPIDPDRFLFSCANLYIFVVVYWSITAYPQTMISYRILVFSLPYFHRQKMVCFPFESPIKIIVSSCVIVTT